jgi:cytochrome c biogenesis protein CcdA
VAGAIFAFPCSVPVILAIIVFANYSNNLLAGALMVVLYIIGHNVLPVAAGVSAKALFKNNGKGSKVFLVIKTVFLVIFAIMAVLIIIEGVHDFVHPHEHVH